MKQPTWAVLFLAGLAGGCELVAGIQDKYLAASDTGVMQVGSSDSGTAPVDDGIDAPAGRVPDATTQPGTTDAPAPPQGDAPEVVDAPSDAGTPPAADAGDAGTSNADTPPDAGTTDPSAPCAQQPGLPLFCDDFDTGSVVKAPWTWGIFSIDGGTSAFYSAAYTSPARSWLVIAPPAAPPSVELLGLDLGTLTAQVRLAFDMRLEMDSLLGLPNTCVAQILAARTGVGMELDYLLRPNQGAMLQCFISPDGGGASINIPLPAPPLRQWTRIVIAYDATAGVSVYEDGALVGSSAAAATGVPNDTKVQIGMIYENGAASVPLQMEMDNVVVRGH